MLFGGDALVYSICAYQSSFKKAKLQSVPGRVFHSLSFRLSGNVAFEINEQRYESSENGITFMPAGISYKTEVTCDGSMLLIHFQTSKNDTSLRPCFLQADDAEAKNLFMQICDSYTADGSQNYKCMSLFYLLLNLLDKPPQLIPKRMRDIKNHIDKSFAEPLNISALAHCLNMSEVYFRSEFKKYYGTSPLAYIKKVRIDNAKLLLCSGYHTVTEVALNCGFDSTSYFSYEFKRLTGMTPTEYIKRSTF